MAAAIAVPTVLTRSRALAGTVPPPSPSESKGKAIRIGVIGCGGRGTGAAFDALKASPDTTIVALGDLFPDRVQGAAAGLAKNPRGVVPSSACFSGFDAYRKVLATDCDMVILATVSAGAELMAEGHIHVYGPLRGRAFAGMSGDTSARIFCRSLDAEMVAIAGIWLIRENLSEALIGRPAQISLENEKLRFQPLG
jgi:hypothetical protein